MILAPNVTAPKLVYRSGVWSECPIKKGQRIEEDMIWSKRPGTGIPSYRMKEVIGKYAANDIAENVLLKEEDFR